MLLGRSSPAGAWPRLSFLTALLLFASCDRTACPGSGVFVGERGAQPELVPAHLVGDRLVPLREGDPVDLVRPVQGGHVLFVGAYVRNIDGCGGSLRGELRRDQGGRPGAILVYDERTSELRHAGADAPAGSGWGSPLADPGEVPNVPACPNVLPDAFLDRPAWLQLAYTARDGQEAHGAVRVVPRCRQEDEAARRICRCECQASYTIERCVM